MICYCCFLFNDAVADGDVGGVFSFVAVVISVFYVDAVFLFPCCFLVVFLLLWVVVDIDIVIVAYIFLDIDSCSSSFCIHRFSCGRIFFGVVFVHDVVELMMKSNNNKRILVLVAVATTKKREL